MISILIVLIPALSAVAFLIPCFCISFESHLSLFLCSLWSGLPYVPLWSDLYVPLYVPLWSDFSYVLLWSDWSDFYVPLVSDAPSPYKFYFQDISAPIFEGLNSLHDTIAFLIIYTATGVLWLLWNLIFGLCELPRKHPSHSVLVEWLLTGCPVGLLWLIAAPSFRWLYLMDDCLDATLTLKAVAAQWNWAFEISDYYCLDLQLMSVQSPLEVFKIAYVGLLTNSALFCSAICGAAVLFALFSLSLETIIPSIRQTSVEMLYRYVCRTTCTTVSSLYSQFSNRIYVPLLFTFFAWLSSLNFSGLIPYSLTATSHIAVTLAHSLALYCGAFMTGFIKHQERYLDMFLPARLPGLLAPAVIVLEILGFTARAISLGVRLSANMLAGHSLLKLICMLIWSWYLQGSFYVILDSLVMFLLFVLLGLEAMVAGIQAYVFTLIASSSITK